MYKAVNVSQETYDQLQKISTQLNKPKAQVVASLISSYEKTIAAQEKTELEEFNNQMNRKIKNLKFSKKIDFDSSKIDEYVSSLADTEYMP